PGGGGDADENERDLVQRGGAGAADGDAGGAGGRLDEQRVAVGGGPAGAVFTGGADGVGGERRGRDAGRRQLLRVDDAIRRERVYRHRRAAVAERVGAGGVRGGLHGRDA